MRKSIFLFVPFFVGAVWHWFWEFIRSVFYERGSHMMAPVIDTITPDQIIHWGPTIAFPLLGFWLIWKTRPARNEAIASSQPDIVVVAPPMNYVLMWDPPRDTFIKSVPSRGGKIASELHWGQSPPFRFKNLGSVVAHNVRLHWEQTMDEQQLLDEINKSEMFKTYPSSNDKKDMRYREFTFEIPFLAPEIDNMSFVNVPIPYYVYLYAETYFTAVISGDQLIKELITVQFRLTISWDRPPCVKQTIFVVTATARNTHPYPFVEGVQFEDEDGKMHPLPKVMAEITFNVKQIAP